ncbi:hypothetical protein GCM10010967_17970 [Dyadobacter beijingensis]|uniref:DUF4270 family protein n=1 Tax=Dyadobacter beijingensis TaxID=365489 RepID=A0ABQ2HNC0_9BACT|nr:DUF4270 family protein [Dyadobacter beijingensis]GGM86166.1 hypothetical protein GCM10010967_17970 [Dyadobacter beijingensis]
MKFKSYSFGRSSTVNKLLIIIGFAFSLTACEWGDEIKSLSQPDPDDFAVLTSDTVTIRLSTIGSDSIMTGGSPRMLFGTFKDPYFGKVRTMNFFQATRESGVSVAQEAEYDSLILSLRYDNTYSYGDTTKPMNLTVYRLLTDILEKSSYWNHNTTAYDPTPIGKVTIVPRPTTTNLLKIRLSDTLGKQIFALAKNNQLTSNTDWINLVKGMVMMPAATDNGPVIGFHWASTYADSSSVQLHYHTPSVSEYKKDSTIFQISASYNHIVADPTGTQLAKIPANKRTSLPSAQSANAAYMQAGTGIMMRVDLPYLRHFKYTQYTAINKAILRIRPLRASVSNIFRVPPILYIYRVDQNNQFYTDGNGAPLPVYMFGGTTPVRSRYVKDLINNDEYYEFDISSYATEIMTSETGDVGGLIIRSSTFSSSGSFKDAGTEYAQSVDRLVVGDQQNANKGVELSLYYTRVKPK